MKSILLSFESDWFSKIESGQCKFEYRKNFPRGPIKVYFYVSRPVKAITGIAIFGERELLSDWLQKYKDRPPCVQERIKDYMEDCRYAIPMLYFQKTNRIPLSRLKEDLENFIVPRMYYFIEDSELEKYLNTNLVLENEQYEHKFEYILDEDICR